MLRTLLARGLDLLFPPRCPGCDTALGYAALTGGASEAPLWCAGCTRLLRTPGLACPSCAQPHLPWLDRPQRSGRCDTCVRDPPPWEFALSRFELSGPAHDAVLRAKTPGGAWAGQCLGRDLARALSTSVWTTTEPTALVPIPLHDRVLAVRGFNQAEEIARALAAATGSVVVNALQRRARGRPQKGLSRVGRADNVRDAFSMAITPSALGDHRVVLVDDVITTTATLRAAAAALRAAGVGTAGVVSVCREP